MSWVTSGTCTIENGTVSITVKLSDEMTRPEVKDQLVQGLTTVKTLVESGAVGDDTKTYMYSISGHANPNHEPAAGWANDTLHVTVAQSYES